ncbi:MAG: hypothetical protein ACLTCI_04055 [[Clostridium] nexile]
MAAEKEDPDVTERWYKKAMEIQENMLFSAAIRICSTMARFGIIG